MKAVFQIKQSLRRFDRKHWIGAEKVALGEKKRMELPGGIVVERKKDTIYVYQKVVKSTPEPKADIFVELPACGSTVLGEKKIRTKILKKRKLDTKSKTRNREYFDLDKLKMPLRIRFRMPGDRMAPFGMKRSKRIKALLIDEKIPLEKRDSVPLIISKGKIIWACGVKRSNLAKVSPCTKRILEIEYGKK